MINFNFNKNCYGCRNCENICPKGAIKISENKEGFLVPTINEEKCIHCGLCDRKCPYLTFSKSTELKKNIWYSCYLKDVKDREKSSSGGIFPAIAKYFIKNNGLVCGCIWNEEMKPIHVLTDKLEDIDKMRGSKYMQSDLQDVIKKIKKEINNKKILFTGTPCQIAAVKLYIGKNKNLYTCGLICEGAGSYKVWKKYVKKLEQKYKSKMTYASFRNKELGWDSPIAKYKFENGKIRKVLSFVYDLYVIGFLQGLYYRNSCNNCQYKGDGHNSDILIGDLWGATKKQLTETQYKGISAVILNTDIGKEMFENVKKEFSYKEIEPQQVIKFNKLLIESINKHKNRDEFYSNLDNIDIMKNIKKNIYKNKRNDIIKEILYKMKIFRLVKDLKK